MSYPDILNNVLRAGYVAFVTILVWGSLLLIAAWMAWATNKIAMHWYELLGGAKEFRRYCRWLKTDAGKEWERDK